MQMIEWVLLVVGAVRVATLNAVLSVVSSRLECVYSPSSELVGSVIEFETSRISAAMFFGMNLSVFRGSSIDRGLGLGVCVYCKHFLVPRTLYCWLTCEYARYGFRPTCCCSSHLRNM